jgi:hypothetical protein
MQVMRKRTLRWLAAAAALVCLGAAAPGPPSDNGGDTRPDRRLLRPFAFCEKDSFVLGEPVYLRLVFANASRDQSYELQGNFHPANDFEILVARQGELPRRYTMGVENQLFPAVVYDLQPLDLVAQRWTLVYEPSSPNGFLFREPGRYVIQPKVRVTVDGQPQNLNFASIAVEITEPDAQQREVLGLILNPDCAEDLQRLQAGEKTAATWRQVIQRFPDSLWAPYGHLLRAWQELEKGDREAEQVAAELQATIKRYPDFLLLDEVYYAVAVAYDRAGDSVKSLEWLNNLMRKFPMSRRIREGDAVFQKYIYRREDPSRYTPWYISE